jgi:hypothetical protein
MFVELIDSTGQSVSGCLVSCQTTEEAARSVIYVVFGELGDNSRFGSSLGVVALELLKRSHAN